MNILILTRKANKDANSIYNSYTNGIINNYPNTVVIDYFNLYFQNGKKGFEHTILKIVKKNKINLIFINFVSGDITLDLTFIHLLSSQCFMMMNFYDTELFFEPIDRYYAQCADLVLLPSSSYLTYNYTLLNINAISTLSLFDTKLYKKLDLEKDIDISFVGDINKKSRKQFLSYLSSLGYHVEIFGSGTQNGHISFDKMIEIFNRSKINLNFSDTVDERSFNRQTNTDYSIVPNIMQYMTQIKGRSIEIALCNGFILTQYATGIEELFSDNEIAIFKTKEELAQQVQYYLSADKRREQMQNKAHKTALLKYDVTVIFSRILHNINLTTRTPKVIYKDKIFATNYATHHTLYLFNFLFRRKLSYCVEEFKIIYRHHIKLSTAFKHLTQQFYYQIIKKMIK